MPFDIYTFLRDHGINFRDEGSKHCQHGWVQIPCPFCTGNIGWHLGYNLNKDYWNCWRCGWKTSENVIKAITGLSRDKIKNIRGSYRVRSKNPVQAKIAVRKVGKVKLPSGISDLSPNHRKYLKERGFNPKELANIWGLKGTGPVGPYKFRVIAPIYLRGKLISYQGRDITGKSDLKYKACGQDRELMDHKDSLYGFDLVPGDGVVVVEGITDAWRLGPGAVATFGIEFKNSQINLLRNFKEVFILFDIDPQAKKQAEKLAAVLSAFNIQVEVLELDSGDPAELSDKEAKKLMKELIL